MRPYPPNLAEGAIDYGRILDVASKGRIRGLFVEQEPPFTEMPALEAIKVDYDYLKKSAGVNRGTDSACYRSIYGPAPRCCSLRR